MVENVLLLLEILLVNIVLSGDNAVVIALASRNLPEHLRNRAIWLGAIGAVGLRIVLSIVAVALLDIPAVQIVGALLLLYIAIHLLLDDGESKEVEGVGSLGKAVGIILVSDLVMSLDNVLAIASIAKNKMWLMAAGIALSIPLIIWGSQLILKLLNRFPAVVWIGSGILGYTAGEMLSETQAVRKLLPVMGAWGVGWFPVAAAIFVLAVAFLWRRMTSSLQGKTTEGKRLH
ncbi:TerC family protein [Cohnella cholangitidis]|uniref:TerC family protein n=1 Tax=Cohnella cholangitidis TaxID=2598458 RepID=A0A7G5C4G1_9BACL|nr:TerC family protein [Cohnella cholangitidis]QMV44095.1 TerC family protein [Cohnella cholangitidis]